MEIIGLNKKFFIIFVICFAVFVLIALFVYFSVVFVNKNEVKISETLSKKRKIKIYQSGIHFLIPLREKIVKTIKLNEMVCELNCCFSIRSKKYNFLATLIYTVDDVEKFYCIAANPFECLKEEITQFIYEKIIDGKKDCSMANDEFLSKIKKTGLTYGIAIRKLFIKHD